MEILLIIIIGVVLSILAAFAVYLIRVKHVKSWWITGGLAVILVILTVSQLERYSVFFEKETPLLAERKKITESLHIPLADTNFIKDHFVLINTSNDNVLQNIKYYADGSSGNSPITDRQKLTALLKLLANHAKQLKLVTCDLIFESPSPADRALNQQLLRLADTGKLALAFEKSKVDITAAAYKGIPETSLGNVSFPEGESQYFTNYLIGELNIPSLSYRMYLTVNQIGSIEVKDRDSWLLTEKAKDGDRSLSYTSYIADLPYQDDEEIYGINYQPLGEAAQHKVNDQGFENGESRSLDLGYCLSEAGTAELLAKLSGGKKIVLIGAFGDQEDLHATRVGALHGTTLLINEFHYFFSGYHKKSYWSITLYLLVMLGGYWGIIQLMFHWAFKEVAEEAAGRHSRGHWIKHYGLIMRDYLFNESHYLSLILFTLVFYLVWHRIINIMALLTYFVVFNSFLKFFAKKLAIPNLNNHAPDHHI